jgi:anionic cell wall polymer biosynthesis LytR-Cps2A-Psr (LCP) family protein
VIVAVGVLDRDRWDANTDNLAVVDPGRRRVTWVPRDLWCGAVGDRINRAFATGGLPLLVGALAEHGLRVDGAVVLRRAATERLLDNLALTVPVPRPLRFLYPLTPTTLVEDGAKVVRFDPPSETLRGERLHQWLGARKVPGGRGSDLHRIRRQQAALRAALRAGIDLGGALTDRTLVRASGEDALVALGDVRSDWSFLTLDDVVPRTIDGKAVLVRDRGPGAQLRALRRTLGRHRT